MQEGDWRFGVHVESGWRCHAHGLCYTQIDCVSVFVPKQTPNCLNTVFMKFIWKSLRIVSLMNRFFGFTSFPWLRKTTSSSHLPLRSLARPYLLLMPPLSEEKSSGLEWSISSRFNAASICAFSSSYLETQPHTAYLLLLCLLLLLLHTSQLSEEKRLIVLSTRNQI